MRVALKQLPHATKTACLPDAGDDANGAELLHQVGLRDGRGQAGHVDTVVVALFSAILAAEKQRKRATDGRPRLRRAPQNTVPWTGNYDGIAATHACRDTFHTQKILVLLPIHGIVGVAGGGGIKTTSRGPGRIY